MPAEAGGQRVECPFCAAAVVAPVDAASDIDEGGKKAKKPLTARQRCGCLAVGVAVVFFGYQYGFGPLLFAALKKPATVIVVNGEDRIFDLSLGWRRQKAELYPMTTAQISTAVGMPEKQRLTVMPRDGGEKRTLKIPVRPGSRTVVNLNRKSRFFIYDPAIIADSALSWGKKMTAELAQKKDPAAAGKIAGQMLHFGKDATLREVESEVIRANAYRLSMYAGMPYRAETGPGPRLRLTFRPCDLSFKGGRLTYDAAQPDVCTAGFQLGHAAEVTLSSRIVIKLEPTAAATLKTTPTALEFSLRTAAHRIQIGGLTFNAPWIYTARRTAAGVWDWRWAYTADMRDGKGVRHRVTAVFPKIGKTTTRVQQLAH